MKKWLWISLFILLLIPGQAQGQSPTDEQLIRLQAGTFDPLSQPEPAPPAGLEAQSAEVSGPYFIVQFTGPIEPAWLAQVEQLGGLILGYIPDNAHIVRIAPEDVVAVESLSAVRWIGPYRAGYKLSTGLGGNLSTASDEERELYVTAFPGESLAELETFLRRVGGNIIESGDSDLGPVLRIRIANSAVTQIVQNPAVNWVEPYIVPTAYNAEGRKIMGAETIWENHGYFGAGQIVAISDSGLSVQGNLSQDFAGRLVRAFAPSEMNLANPACTAKTNWTDLDGHGTHVAGSVLGSGLLSGSNPGAHQYTASHAGLAPEADLVFMALQAPNNPSFQCIDINGDFIAKGYQEGARISSNSWGGAGGYSRLSQLVDTYIRSHPDYLVLFAAGNNGENGATTIGAPGTAKNILTVGATENNRPEITGGWPSTDPDKLAPFSSLGPTADGRIKPDVVSPGTNVISVLGASANALSPIAPGQPYALSSGTSMATPLTAGAAALVREWVGKDRNLANPSAALLKALLIHGAGPLPNAATPNPNSGWGRVDLKNTLDGQYVIFDDHVQGLTTGQQVDYAVNVVGSTSLGTAFTTPSLHPAGANAALALGPGTAQVVAASSAITQTSDLQVQPLPSFEASPDTTTISSSAAATKNGAPLNNLTPSLAQTPALSVADNAAFSAAVEEEIGAANFLQGMVGGGNFEDPGWTNGWELVWLGSGIPLRTSNPSYVISGNYSMWLGGTPVEDSLWYPLQFPDNIDSTYNSYLDFDIRIADQDVGFDTFCAAIIDASGYFIGPYATSGPDCVSNNGLYNYSKTFTTADKNVLAGQTGYLVLYMISDGALPHMSAFVDDVVLAIDFPSVTLTSTPASGPAGTTFLLTGKYNVPYGVVDICVGPCSTSGNPVNTVYANAEGDIAAYLSSSTSALPGPYSIQSRNLAGRTANTSITILGGVNPTLNVTPSSGSAGTKFDFSGADFLPNDNNITVQVNGSLLGTTGSNSSGQIAFNITTNSNTPAGTYNVQASDGANRSAATAFQVTAIPSGNPALTVTPGAGPAGTGFTFTGNDFTPNTNISLALDGQALGTTPANAAGGFEVTLNTNSNAPPGFYTLQATQGIKQASAQFEITDSSDLPQSGDGLYLTLVWVDPAAQLSAGKTLVNNLDLTVQGPNGTIFGNGGASADTVNNVETIRLNNPTPGTYNISVQAQQVDSRKGAQPFALVGTTQQSFSANTDNVSLDKKNVYLPVIIRQ